MTELYVGQGKGCGPYYHFPIKIFIKPGNWVNVSYLYMSDLFPGKFDETSLTKVARKNLLSELPHKLDYKRWKNPFLNM